MTNITRIGGQLRQNPSVLERADQWCHEHEVMTSREICIERVARGSLLHFETRFQTETFEQLSDRTKQGIARMSIDIRGYR